MATANQSGDEDDIGTPVHGVMPQSTIKDQPLKALPKRFYKAAAAVALDGAEAQQFGVQLDGRRLKTPAKRPFALPTLALAEAAAAEWAAQRETIDAGAMPLTTLVNSATDGVATAHADVSAEVANYAMSDLLCYRAESPVELVARQAASWDPLLAWAETYLGAKFKRTAGIMHVAQDEAIRTAVAAKLREETPLRLAAINVLTTLLGSAVAALTVSSGHATLETVWQAAHVDEDWQIALWGQDADATLRRARRRRDAAAAALVLSATA